MDHRSNNDNNGGEGETTRNIGSPVHSQVRKIMKEEFSEKSGDWLPGKPERRSRPVHREFSRQLSRSPLGISRRPISVGD